MIRHSRNIVLAIAIITLTFLLPLLYETIFKPLPEMVLISYSTYKDEFLINKKEEAQSVFTTSLGKQITKEDYYAWLPVFYYRKLEHDGILPDSVNGEPLTINNLKKHNYFFRINDGIVNEVQPVMLPMFESADEATHFNINNNFFSFKNKIEFVDVFTGDPDHEKSKRFTTALLDSGFVFPVKKIFGDVRQQKNYDNGYYLIDSNNHLFTLKMSLGKPVVNIVPLPAELSIRYMLCTDPLNMEILSVIISQNNNIFLHLGTSNIIVKTDIQGYNPECDELLIFGNQFNKTFLFQNDREIRLNVINDNYSTFRSFCYKKRPQKFKIYDAFMDLVCPVQISFNFRKEQVVKPVIKFPGSYYFLILNLLLAVFYYLLRKKEKPLAASILIFITGIPGLISFLLIRKL